MREPLPQSDEERAEDAYWEHLYGAWDPFDLDAGRAFLEGFDRPWWLVGGWAIEAFTGAPREHEDLDASQRSILMSVHHSGPPRNPDTRRPARPIAISLTMKASRAPMSSAANRMTKYPARPSRASSPRSRW